MSEALAAAREALGSVPAWVVGGAVRDRLLGRDVEDVDLVVAGDPEVAARELAAATRSAVFALSGEFGHWRVEARDRSWSVDLVPLAGERIEDDLSRRDFTVNAIAEPLAGGGTVDPHAGRDDLEAGRLRMVGEGAFTADPLRVLRLARLACELRLDPDPPTIAAARAAAPGLARVAGERLLAELVRIVGSPRPLEGLALMDAAGGTAAVLPEIAALRGVDQSAYHHLDVHDHTLAVVAEVVSLERDPSALGPRGPDAAAGLAEPFADGLTGWVALRIAALLHDVAKPATRIELPDGRVGFPGHDRQGAEQAREILGRLRASERLRAHVAALTRHHLRLGFLVHEAPLPPRALWEYLEACSPVEVEVGILSVADRLATRGRRAEAAIARHLALGELVLAAALDRRAAAGTPPLVRGDALARELGIAPGPEVGRLLEEIAAARYAGEIATEAQAIEHARAVLARDVAAGSG